MSAWMGHIVISGDADPNLGSALALLGDGPFNAWLENEAHADGLQVDDNVPASDAALLMKDWPVGRFFTEAADLRWERQADGSLYVVIMADGAAPAFIHDPIALEAVDEPHDLLLWGMWSQERGWYEGRIAKVGRFYPDFWKTGPYAAIRARTYEDANWLHAEPDIASVRIVTRYLRYRPAMTPEKLAPSS